MKPVPVNRANPLRAALLCALGLGAVGAAQAAIQVRADFNGDGFDDLAVGVPGEGFGNVTFAGAVNVIYGSKNRLSATGNQLLRQTSSLLDVAELGDQFGTALAAGDFNADGFADLAVGVPDENLGSTGNIPDAGVVHVIYGSKAGLVPGVVNAPVRPQLWFQGAGPNGVLRDVVEPNNRFGAALATGDFNKDGFADLAVGVPGEIFGAGNEVGAVNMIFGSAKGLTDAGNQLLRENALFGNGEKALDHFGAALAAGDFDGDHNGVADDLAIGVPGNDLVGSNFISLTDAGSVAVVLGSPGFLCCDADDIQLLHQDVDGIADTAESSDRFGAALAAGDFNGDDRDDLAVGVPDEDLGSRNTILSAGAVNVIVGGFGGLVGGNEPLWHQDFPGIADSAESGDSFGAALGTGDFNGDGSDDLAVGVPSEDLAGGSTVGNAGAVNVIYGAGLGAGLLTATGNQFWHQDVTGIEDAAETGDLFGNTLAVGDFNGDGFADLAVGVLFEDLVSTGNITNAGVVNVIYGTVNRLDAANDQLWHQDVAGILDAVEPDDLFGRALAGLGSGSAGGPGLSGKWQALIQHCAARCRIRGTLKVFNPGTATAQASVLRFHLSDDSDLDKHDPVLKSVKVTALEPGKAVQVKLDVLLAPGKNAQGEFVIAVLDATDVVPEVNEDNNSVVSPPIP